MSEQRMTKKLCEGSKRHSWKVWWTRRMKKLSGVFKHAPFTITRTAIATRKRSALSAGTSLGYNVEPVSEI